MTGLLGGRLSPIGCSVQFVRAPLAEVVRELAAWRHTLGATITVSEPAAFADAVTRFLPFEAPWTRELLFDADGITGYLNNFVNGGDPTASAVVVAARLRVDHVVATHAPMNSAGHATTQLTITQTDGTTRYLASDCADRRWRWHEGGEPMPFEDVGRYRRRLVRERFDRPMLLRYLGGLGIRLPDEDAAIGDALVVRQTAPWARRTQTLEQARADSCARSTPWASDGGQR